MNSLTKPLRNHKKQEAFTLVEMMTSLFLMGLVMVAALAVSVHSARNVQDGTEHISFVDEARSAENVVGDIIQKARAISIPPHNQQSLTVVQPDLTRSLIYYEEGDSVKDNRLMYDPDTSISGNERIIARYVSGIPGKNMFEIIPGDRNTTIISLYVGLRPPEDGASAGIRKSYTGANVYIIATPRNIIDFIQN